MQEHTPGPWKATKDTTVRGNPSWRIDSDEISLLASLEFTSTKDRDTFGKSNAELIAAAPELRRALLDLLDGQSWQDLQRLTGLPDERCQTIIALGQNLKKVDDKGDIPEADSPTP